MQHLSQRCFRIDRYICEVLEEDLSRGIFIRYESLVVLLDGYYWFRCLSATFDGEARHLNNVSLVLS